MATSDVSADLLSAPELRVDPRPAPDPREGAGALPRARVSAAGLLLGVLAFGVYARLLQYVANRSLWLDEALLAPTVTERTWTQLADPAHWGPTPPGFLFLAKAASTLFGTSEPALRLVPLLAGMAALWLFVRVARKCLSPEAVLPAAALFALSPFLIYYASELKPYSSDAAVSLALLLLALHLAEGGVTRRRAALLAAAGVAAVGFSFPAALVLGGIVVALAARYARAGDRRSLGMLAAVCAAWAVAFGVPYLLFVGAVAANDYAQAFWRSGFMPLPPTSLEELKWFPHALLRTFEEPLGVLDAERRWDHVVQAVAGVLVFAAGCAAMARGRRRTALLVLLLPVAAALLASGLRKYPFGSDWSTGGRVILFLVPSFYLVMGEGAASLRRRFGARLRPAALVVLAALFLPLGAAAALGFPSGRAEVKPVLEHARRGWRAGDVLYVHYDARPALRYYAPRYGFAETDLRQGPCARFEPQRYLEALAELRGAPRVWVLFAGGTGAFGFDERALMLGYLDATARRVESRVARGASVYLYDLQGQPTRAGGFRARVPAFPRAVAEGCALWGGDAPAR